MTARPPVPLGAGELEEIAAEFAAWFGTVTFEDPAPDGLVPIEDAIDALSVDDAKLYLVCALAVVVGERARRDAR